MNFKALNDATQLCDQGNLQFNTGTHYAFLYHQKWYPLRAIVNYADPNNDYTKDQCLRELIDLLKVVRIEQVNFMSKFPVKLSDAEMLKEIKLLMEAVNMLV